MNFAEQIEECADALNQAGVEFGHGTDNAWDEAAWLVLHAAGLPCDGSFEDWARPVPADCRERVRGLMERRVGERKPLAYLIGEAWFCGLRFVINESVLVPRSPIAELIRRGFEPWVRPGRLGRVLDLCTGSGCIAVAIARHLPETRVDAADISRDALGLAEANAREHGVAERVQLLHSDLFEDLQQDPYDLIVSNPPYVPTGELAGLPPEYRAEPGLGLAAGADGLDLALRILHGAPGHLAEDGVLICEVGESAGRLQEILGKVPLTWLEFEHGGEGVFTIGSRDLQRAGPLLASLIEKR